MRTPEITDMHAHLSCTAELEEKKITWQEAVQRGARELALRRSCGIRTFVSAGRPWEWELMREIRRASEKSGADFCGAAAETPDYVSFGIHPWYADQFRPEEYSACFQACDAVGEIGMDAVWCEVPVPIQQKRLEKQLQIAADLGKPVVLHTKGCEERIAELLRGFPGKILIHWFSGAEKELELFLKLDCYFTLGPDLSREFSAPESGARARKADGPAALYHTMLREIPENRLFLETDGRSGVEWALGRTLQEEQIPEILRENLRTAAWAKQCSEEAFAAVLEVNRQSFMRLSSSTPSEMERCNDFCENFENLVLYFGRKRV